MAALLDAAVFRKVLNVAYESQEEDGARRDIQPLSIYAHNGFWYCHAYCFLRQGFRVFRCDRVRAAEPSDREPLDLEDIPLSRRHEAGPRESVRLRAKLSPAGVQRCESELWLAPMLSVREDGSGTIDRDVPRSDIPFYADFFIGLGSAAELSEPAELKTAIRVKLRELLDSYS